MTVRNPACGLSFDAKPEPSALEACIAVVATFDYLSDAAVSAKADFWHDVSILAQRYKTIAVARRVLVAEGLR